MRTQNTILFSAVTATGASGAVATDQFIDHTLFIRASSVTSGCTLVWEASPDNSNWHTLQSIAVTANGNTVQKQVCAAPYMRANITARTDGTYTVLLYQRKEQRS